MKYGTLTYLSVDGKVLMVNKKVRDNDPNSGFFTLPGGKLESNEVETPLGRLEGAIREMEEETGLRILNSNVRGTILFNNKKREFVNWKNPDDYLVYIFESSEFAGCLVEETDEGNPVWVPEKEIVCLPQNDGDKRMYEWLGDGRPFYGEISHVGKSLDDNGTFVKYFGTK